MFGFKHQLVSKNEILYKHGTTSEVYAILCEEFTSYDKDVEFHPITHGDLWRRHAEELKVHYSSNLLHLKPCRCVVGKPDSGQTIATEEVWISYCALHG